MEKNEFILDLYLKDAIILPVKVLALLCGLRRGVVFSFPTSTASLSQVSDLSSM